MELRIIVCSICIFLLACSVGKEELSEELSPADAVTETVYADFSVESYRLVLKGIAGRCVIAYSNPKDVDDFQTIDTKVEGPCQFVRTGFNLERPQSYIYNEGESRRSVLLIVGGPAHPRATDRFFPNGCGTRLLKVHVFSNRIETEELTGYYPIDGTNADQGPFCAGSMDEKTFAS